MKNENIREIVLDILKNGSFLKGDKRYFEIKNREEEVKKFFMEKFGYDLIIENGIAKLERFPDRGDSGIGIKEFVKIEHYIIFIIVLDFLEEIEAGRTILISDLVTYITENYPQEVDWKSYYQNLAVIKVLKYCQEKNIIKLLDGSETDYLNSDGKEVEVLYENSGISRSFMRNLPIIIESLTEWKDYYSLNNKEQFNFPLKRAARGLLNNCIVNREDEVYNDILEYREILQNEFETMFGAELVITTDFAYIKMDKFEKEFSDSFPDGKNISSVILLLCNEIKKEGRRELKIRDIEIILEKIVKEYGKIVTKENQRKESTVLCEEVIKIMEELNFLKREDEIIKFSKIVEKIDINIDIGEIRDESVDSK